MQDAQQIILNNIVRQLSKLRELGVVSAKVYLEHDSGTKTDRIELDKLLDRVIEGDTIVATEVSRIIYSTKQLCEIIELAKIRKIKLVFGTFVVDCIKQLDPITKGILELASVLLEVEYNKGLESPKTGMAKQATGGTLIGIPCISR